MHFVPHLRVHVARWLAALGATGGSLALAVASPEPGLVWDALKKSHQARLGETVAELGFLVTNQGGQPAVITEIEPSCGCTTVQTPPLPWRLAGGEKGMLHVKVDLADKFGEVTKTIRVVSKEEAMTTQELQVVITIPVSRPAGIERERAQGMARENRLVIFEREDCRAYHAQPARDKFGQTLFQAACAICHTAEHRASMVPDLGVAREPRDATWWRNWIAHGRDHTMMPAFAQDEGGPLTPPQIESLVEFALGEFPRCRQSP